MIRFLSLFLLVALFFPTLSQNYISPYLLPRDSTPISIGQAKKAAQAFCENPKITWENCKAYSFEGGKLWSVGDKRGPVGGLSLDSIMFGSFTVPNAREALVSMTKMNTSCCYGFTAIFDVSKTRWKIKRFDDMDTGSCLRFRDGRGLDQLGCGFMFSADSPERPWAVVLGHRFDSDGDVDKENTKLFVMEGFSSEMCKSLEDLSEPTNVREVSIRNWGKKDLDLDSKPDLAIVIGIRDYGKLSSLTETCTMEKPKLKVYKLIFTMKDQGLVPTETTEKIIAQISK